MAIDFDFSVDTTLSVAECKQLLMRELSLKVSPQRPDLWLYAEDIIVTVHQVQENTPDMRLARYAYGFTPTLGLMMRPELRSKSDIAFITIMRIVDLMLRSTEGDAGFSFQTERVLLLRRDGEVFVREDYRNHLNDDKIALITVPYQLKPLKP